MERKSQFRVLYAVSFAWQLGFLIAIPMVLLILIGLWLDNYFQTHPLFIVAGAVAGISLTVYEVYHHLHPLIHHRPSDD